MSTYWSLDLYMNPGSPNALNGRFEANPTLSVASSPNGPWSQTLPPHTPPNSVGHFWMNAGDYLRVVVYDMSGRLTTNSVQMAAVFGRDHAATGGGSKSSPFVTNAGGVNCVLPMLNQGNTGTYYGWWTADWCAQGGGTGDYRFLIYAMATDNTGVQWQFGHDPEMDVTAQK